MFSALLGNPVEHSVSPLVFTYLASKCDYEYSHLKLLVPHEDELKDFSTSLSHIGCLGYNVTLPYKIKIIEHLNFLSPESKGIGAVNTVKISNGLTTGYNTDAIGAISAINKKLRPLRSDDSVIVFGAGGAARAIIFEVSKVGCEIIVMSRNILEAESVRNDFKYMNKNLVATELSETTLASYIKNSTFLINATPVGMYPESNASILRGEFLERINPRREIYVFDAIFNPLKTRFLEDAEKYLDAKTCSGIWMLIYQAIAAFELWTGKKVHTDIDFGPLITQISIELSRNKQKN